jgi:hypothetical protein
VEGLVTSLAVLACPIGMGAMMWFMMRGIKQPAKGAGDSHELVALRAEQQRLQNEVGRLRETTNATTRDEVPVASR